MERIEHDRSFSQSARNIAQTATAMIVGMVIGAAWASSPAPAKIAEAPRQGTVWSADHARIPYAPLPAEQPPTF
jgi:hypothetical protein